MKFLLDSNAVIAILERNPGLLARLRSHRPEDFYLSAIVVHELVCGAYRSQRVAENVVRIEGLRLEVS